MKIKNYIRRKPYTININENYTILELATKMLSEDEESVVILNGKIPVYIITGSDLINFFVQNLQNMNLSYIIENFPKDIIKSYDNDDVYTAYKIMRSKKIEHMIIVNKNEELVGEVFYGDLVMKFVEFSLKDELTTLNNRRFLDSVLARYSSTTQKVGLIFIDIDDFKHINDKYGHKKGDEVLANVGKVIKESIRELDFGFRYGGDEFLVMILGEERDILSKITKRLFDKLSSIKIDNNKNLKVSMGISLYPDDSSNIYKVLKLADDKLYEVKNSGKGNFKDD